MSYLRFLRVDWRLLGALQGWVVGMHVGAIKALSTAIVVLGSATSPAIFGLLLDRGGSAGQICAGCVACIALFGLVIRDRFWPKTGKFQANF